MAVIDRKDRVCVVGAGSSGLAAAKALLVNGLAVDVIEREDEVGGNWNFGKPQSRVYRSTHMISSKPFTQYPDFPMPDEYPDYPHHSHVLDYLRRYAKHFGLYDVMERETAVEQVVPHDGGKSWDVTVRKLRSGAGETRRYGALVVANGHNWFPKIPEYPGTLSVPWIHSADYKSSDVLRDKRVLVVGAGNTGCDVAVEGAQAATRTFHSARRGYWYALKYSFGKPSDQVYDLLLAMRLPLPVLRFMLKSAAKMTVGDQTRYGLPRPDHEFLETHPIVNSQLVYHVGHGDIVPKPDVARFDDDVVTFTDGSREEVDLVVYCTGYLVRFPFMDHRYLNFANGRPRLYENVFHPEHPNVAVIGLIQPDSGQFKLVHWQSVAVAKYLRAQRESPELAARFAARVRDQLDLPLSGGVAYKESTRHHFEVQHMSYLRGLARDVEVLS